MAKTARRILLVMLSAMFAAIFAVACKTEEEFPSWKLTSGITAAFSDNGSYGFILTVEGSGEMDDFSSKKDAPWYTKSGRVTEIEVSDGITHIGSNSFTDCAAKSVMLPRSVTSAGENAFSEQAKIYAYSKLGGENVYCYSERQPEGSGKYWHFVDGDIAIWKNVDTSPQKILFVGNSYTYYNDMPAIFREIAISAGATVTVESVTMGSHRLYMWADPADAEGAKLYAKLKASADYDKIVLQEQSTYPINHYDTFLSGAKTLAGEIAKTQSDCKIYLYETWGSPQYAGSHGGIPQMEAKLRSAYESVGAEIGAKVSYVGKAFTYVYENHKEIGLYQPDQTHPTYAGSYLSACVHAASMLGIDPRTSTYRGELDAATATLMKSVAYQIVFEA